MDLLSRPFALAVIIPCAAAGLAAGARTEPNAWDPAAEWARTPVESLSSTRERMVLNGPWRFRPAGTAASGWLRVPGTWAYADWPRWNLEGPLDSLGKPWNGPDWRALAEGSYERGVAVPAGWKRRAIVLRVLRPSARAGVSVNGKPAGMITWPGGELNLTDMLVPGKTVSLGIAVTASATSPSPEARGLAGDVVLEARPRGGRIDGVFIRPSVRRKSLALDVDLAGVKSAEPVKVTVEITPAGAGPEAKPARVFTADASVTPGAQTVQLEWAWPDPVLWDAGKPFLYSMRLRVGGAGWRDEIVERFGFREFRIEGREFLLNERRTRLRPFVWLDENEVAGMPGCIGRVCDGLVGAGFNILEIWPDDTAKPGAVHFNEEWAGAADERGLLVMYPALSIESFIAWDGGEEKAWAAWERAMVAEWKRVRNHPSIVILVSTANRFGYPDDLNPLRIGRGSAMKQVDPAGRRMLETIRRHDPTRPLTSHHGGSIGDLHTANTYLDLIPLQEREEWPSAWAERGDRPFMAVEFGTPLSCTFQRGRCQYGENRVSEPLMTEFCAIYLGSEAYRLETPGYRAMIAAKFRGGQSYEWVTDGAGEFNGHPAHQRLQALFDRNTWRSWRGWGVTGGMIPWEWGHGWLRPEGGMDVPPPPPGRAGSWSPGISAAACRGFSAGGMTPTPAGEALLEVARPQIAWIAGEPDAWTAKDHVYRPGDTVRKSLAVVNDGPGDEPFQVSWIAEFEPGRIAWGRKGETLAAGTGLFLPVDFPLPASLGAFTSGTILLEARMGGTVFRDAFAVTIVPPPAVPVIPNRGSALSSTNPADSSRPEVLVHDPEGETKAWIERLGWRTRMWNGRGAPGALLVVGRHALDRGGKLPGSVGVFVESGGRAILMGQDPAWLRERAGFRVARHVTRRAFPVPSPAWRTLLAGVDAEVLRDWRGSGTLVPETDGVPPARDEARAPEYGWHWGNRGSVSSAAIEKPHRSGWTPVLEAEFDLAYTPLMELAVGRGLAFWCTLDLEGRVGLEPAADLVASRLLEYAWTARSRPRAARTVYAGGPAGHELLRSAGLRFTRTGGSGPPGLLVAAADAGLSRADFDRYLAEGWRVLVLPRPAGELPFGFRAVSVTGFAGSLDVPPWPECRGLSASDLRLRAPVAAALLSGGPGTGAGGLLGRTRSGTGVAILLQLTPDMLDAEKLTYLRYSSWRLTRALSQLLANLGGEFVVDRRSLEWREDDAVAAVPLAGTWQARIEHARPTPKTQAEFREPPNEGFGKGWAAPGAAPEGWVPMPVPGPWEKKGGEWDMDGVAWYRREVDVPAGWAGRDLVLELGRIDDFDTAYWNGAEVGATPPGTPLSWEIRREYRVPGRLVGAGRNTIAVRIFDAWGGGGFGGPGPEMRLSRSRVNLPDFYVPGFRTDFPLGDDPYRYYRW